MEHYQYHKGYNEGFETALADIINLSGGVSEEIQRIYNEYIEGKDAPIAQTRRRTYDSGFFDGYYVALVKMLAASGETEEIRTAYNRRLRSVFKYEELVKEANI